MSCGAEVGTKVVRFILEGVSVDLGRTMLPVSPQFSLSAESPLVHGDRGMLLSSTSVGILFHAALPGAHPSCQSC
jgi:hypothetical protein